MIVECFMSLIFITTVVMWKAAVTLVPKVNQEQTDSSQHNAASQSADWFDREEFQAHIKRVRADTKEMEYAIRQNDSMKRQRF